MSEKMGGEKMVLGAKKKLNEGNNRKIFFKESS
jgi:hypothetical protein